MLLDPLHGNNKNHFDAEREAMNGVNIIQPNHVNLRYSQTPMNLRVGPVNLAELESVVTHRKEKDLNYSKNMKKQSMQQSVNPVLKPFIGCLNSH